MFSSRKLALQKCWVGTKLRCLQDEEDAAAEHHQHVAKVRHACAERLCGGIGGAGDHGGAFRQPGLQRGRGGHLPDHLRAPHGAGSRSRDTIIEPVSFTHSRLNTSKSGMYPPAV